MITISAEIKAPVHIAWVCWTTSEYITQWNHASDDWHCPYAENFLFEGGRFRYTMAAKDGSESFDLTGVHTRIKPYSLIESVLDDGRKMSVVFEEHEFVTYVTQSFEPENENPEELQRAGWLAILMNYKAVTDHSAAQP